MKTYTADDPRWKSIGDRGETFVGAIGEDREAWSKTRLSSALPVLERYRKSNLRRAPSNPKGAA